MNVSEYKNIYDHEENHFYYKTTFDLVVRLVRQYSKRKTGLKILDAGCGTGMLAQKMAAIGFVSTFDVSPEAIRWAKRRGVVARRGSIEKIPFRSRQFDVVTCIDVIVHSLVKNDIKAISDLYRVLKPGGIMVMRTAANSWIHMAHDENALCFRRYDKTDLINKLVGTGFKVKKISFTQCALFPLMVARFFLELICKTSPASTITDLPGWLNRLMVAELNLENDWMVKHNLPFGIGLIVVCRKPV